jgi:imidazolonepropionase-like amidohydrolase
MIVHLLCLTTLLAIEPPPRASDSWVVRAGKVYTAAGDSIENGSVVVEDGKIRALGGGGGESLECDAVTPGLIDLSPRITTGNYSVEQSTEAAITTDVLDALDVFSYRFASLMESGVTTVMVAPLDHDVFGGLSAAVKTGGPATLEARVLKRAAALRAAIGDQPSSGNFPPRGQAPTSFYARRPTTRMGVEWIFRKAYYDILAEAQRPDGAKTEFAPEAAVLGRTLSGELPVMVQAWATQDIRTACALKTEFGIPNMIVDAAAEAWKEPLLLVRSGMGVVLPPFTFEGRTGEGAFFAWDTAAKLHELGVPVALSAHGQSAAGTSLAHQAGFAMRGGLAFDAALAAVTIVPARMAGVDDRVGSIEVGKDADLVLWRGTPFEPTARIVGVILNGELVVDPRSTK